MVRSLGYWSLPVVAVRDARIYLQLFLFGIRIDLRQYLSEIRGNFILHYGFQLAPQNFSIRLFAFRFFVIFLIFRVFSVFRDFSGFGPGAQSLRQSWMNCHGSILPAIYPSTTLEPRKRIWRAPKDVQNKSSVFFLLMQGFILPSS